MQMAMAHGLNSGLDFQGESLNSLNEAMNKNTLIDPSLMEIAKQQCLNNIQQNLKIISIYEQYQNLISSSMMQNNMTMSPMMSMSPDMSKSTNIFTPKPMHASRLDATRIEKCSSVFTPYLSKSDSVGETEKAANFERESENETENSDKNKLSDDNNSRKRMNVFRCPHTDRKHYAKNMCNNCYHKLGRNKKANKCPHKDRQNYAKGKCQNCYLNDYHKVKRKMKKQQQSKKNSKKQEEVDRRISVETSSTEQELDDKPQTSSAAQE